MSTRDPGSADLSRSPLQPPPTGITSNFINPPTRAGEVLGVEVVLIILSTTFVILRLYTRLLLVCRFDVGDYLLLSGYVLALANSAVIMRQTTFGLGRHAWDIQVTAMFPHNQLYAWWGIKLYILSLGFTKLAILCLYPRISPSRTFRVWTWVLLGLVACSLVTTLVWSITYCLPVNSFWSLAYAVKGGCQTSIGFLVFSGATNVATDLAILILPIVMLRHVAIPPKKKIAIAVVLATGSFVSVISVIRLVVSIKALKSYDDVPYKTVNLFLWSSAEVHVAVICACITSLSPFIRRFFPSLVEGSATRAANGRGPRPQVRALSEGHIRLRELEITPKSARCCGTVAVVGKGQEGRDNTSKDYILCDKTFTVTESGGAQDVENHGPRGMEKGEHELR